MISIKFLLLMLLYAAVSIYPGQVNAFYDRGLIPDPDDETDYVSEGPFMYDDLVPKPLRISPEIEDTSSIEMEHANKDTTVVVDQDSNATAYVEDGDFWTIDGLIYSHGEKFPSYRIDKTTTTGTPTLKSLLKRKSNSMNSKKTGPRKLQSCPVPAISNGYWSGAAPATPASWCTNTHYSYSSYAAYCNGGYYGSGSGTCTFWRYCYTYSYRCGLWSTCYACTCNGISTSFTIKSGGVCYACSPPYALNSYNVYSSGWSWNWYCNKGYYGTSVSRTCSSTTGTWGGSAISCTACSPPAITNGYAIQQSASMDSWRYTCKSGYFGAAATLVCSTTAGTFTGTVPTCTVCNSGGGGYYCLGGEDTGGVNFLGRYKCPGGRYGDPNQILTTSACSGPCSAGYYCPDASTSATQFKCGGVNLYCPQGSSQATIVTPGYYTTPVTASEFLRTGQAICPVERECVTGILLPAVDYSANCPNGATTLSVLHGTTGSTWGNFINATSPGYTGGLTYSLSSVTTFDSTCNPTTIASALSYDSAAGRFRFSNSYTASSILCRNGFSVTITASRNNNNQMNAQCAVTVKVQQIPLAPTFPSCGPYTINERTGIGAAISAPVKAVTDNYGTQIFYKLNETLNTDIPFSIGLCDGMLTSTKDLQWKDGTAYNVIVTAINDGTSIGIGTISSNCNATVYVTQVPLPPVPAITSFTVPELSQNGTFIGNLEITDPAGYPITKVIFGSVDNPNAVGIDDQGNLTVIQVVDTLVLVKSIFRLTVNISNPYIMKSYPITVTFTSVPRPPVTSDQIRSIREDALGGFQLGPPLNASSPQNSPFAFTLTPNSTFDITTNGIPYLNPGKVLNYNNQPVYYLTFIVTDSNGLLTTATLTINIIEVNRPPIWYNSINNTGVWNFEVDENTICEQPLPGNRGIVAIDPNTKDSLFYRIRSITPRLTGANTNKSPFAVDSLTGALTVGTSLENNMLRYDEKLTYVSPFTFVVNVSARDSGIPTLDVNGTVFVTITNIYPRLNSLIVNLKGDANAGDLVANLSTVAWTPYDRSRLVYAISCELRPDGLTPFVVDSVTGNVSVSTQSIDPLANNGTGKVVWDYNAKSSYKCNTTLTDSMNGRASISSLSIVLQHVNRAPTWKTVPLMFTPAMVSLNVGVQLSQYLIDPDLSLNIGENFTFTMGAGNTDNTFAINSLTGQIYVLNNNTPSFVYPANGPGPIYNISITVTDAGIDGPKYSAETIISIQLTENQLPPTIAPKSFTLAEHVPVGTIVGTITATAPAPGTKLYYLISPIDNNINKPFPFNVSTIPDGAFNSARLFTINDGPINYSPYAGAGEFRTYKARITVVDDHRGYPITAQADIRIDITWVSEPPFFDSTVIPPAYRPNLYTFTITVPENSVPGTMVGSNPINGYSKDPWTTLTYQWINLGAFNSWFTLNPSTAVVTVNNGAILDYETGPLYTLYVRVNDTGTNLQDTATVNIKLVDVNDAAVFVGLGDSSNTTLSVNYLSVNENATVGTIVGYVRFWDGDYTPLWGSKTYFLSYSTFNDDLTGFAYTLFDIDPNTGAVYIKTAALDWNDQDTWHIVVSVIDSDPYNPIIVNTTVTVKIIQCNTVSVTSISAPTVEFTLNNVLQVSTSSYATSHTSNDILCVSTGCTLYLIGTGFGKTARRLAVEGLSTNPTTITATYGPRGIEYPALCTVFSANTMLECTIPPNVGRDHVFTITVNGKWTKLSIAKFGFIPPSILAVYRTGYDPSNPSLQTMRTDAVNEYITIKGKNMGPLAVSYASSVLVDAIVVRMRYGPTGNEYVSPLCNWKVAHEEISCQAVPGIGRDHTWFITVGFQTSAPFIDNTLRYTSPAITNVGTAGIFLNSNNVRVLDTRGNEPIIINGTNFGPAGTTKIVLTYSSNFNAPALIPIFTAVQCIVPSYAPHVSIVCLSVPGMGGNLYINVNVGNQDSGISTDTIGYRIPIIYDLHGLGADNATTRGGQSVTLDGDQFGPVTETYANGTGFGVYVPFVRYGHRTLNPLPYIALECRVIVAHTKIVCFTTQGTGRDLVWNVYIGSQQSGAFLGRTTSYHPPIVAGFRLPYEPVSETYGQQLVQIDGRNFGPDGVIPDKVTYGPTGYEFVASNCVLDLPHDRLNCTTVVGASRNLIWKIIIDGQESVSPTTAYGQPIITSFSGVGAIDANTDGGQLVTLHGRYLSVQQHLGLVTYGPSGTEFKANNCTVTNDHTEITCLTVPGTGRVLRWIVQVGNQYSEPSIPFTSYAYPTITAVIPANSLTNGEKTITIEALNAGLRYAASKLEIRLNNESVPYPGGLPAIDKYWTDVRAGRSGNITVRDWILELASPAPTYLLADNSGKHTIRFTVPSGYGPNCDLMLVVDGVPSDIVSFTYDPPFIVNIAPDRQNVSAGSLRVFVDGTSFCDGTNNCGEVYMNGVKQPITIWSHNQIMFIIKDLPEGSPEQAVEIRVSGIASNIRYFSKPVPNFNALVGQDTFVNMDTVGSQPLTIHAVADIGLEPVNITVGGRQCTNITRAVDNGVLPTDSDATFTLTCKTPEGVGLGNFIIVTALGGSSRADSSFVLDYAPPTITSIERVSDGTSYVAGIANSATIPTLGEIVRIRGMNLGTSYLDPQALFMIDNMIKVTIITHKHDELTVLIPPGDGTNHLIQFIVGMQESNVLQFSYSIPVVSGIAPSTGSTVGGQLVTITGSNFGVTVPQILIGSAPCIPIAAYAPTANHDTIKCYTPNYEGGNLPVIVKVTGQTSIPSTVSPVTYSYIPPVVVSLSPASGPTSGGNNITLYGTNLGTGGSNSYIILLPDQLSRPEDIPIPVLNNNIYFWNDTMIIFGVPEGYGERLIITVYAGNQPSTSATPLAAVFAYDPPSISRWNHHERMNCEEFSRSYFFNNQTYTKKVPVQCFDTRGDYIIDIYGASFSKLFVAVSVRIGVRPCILITLTHDHLTCRVPRGLGDINPIVITVGGRSSPLNGNITNFSYDPPIIDAIVPNTPNALGANITVRGKNFGYDETPFIANISGLLASRSEWLGDSIITFTTVEDVVGPKRIEFTIANRSSPYIFFEFEQIFIAECKSGYWGLTGEKCLVCPRGAKCPGSEAAIDLLTSKPGFWRSEISNPSELCPEEHRNKIYRPVCPVFSPCEPPGSCLGDNICAEGYEGARCAQCIKGKYYRVNGECIKCPDSPIAVIISFILLAMLALVVSWALTKYNITIALISIGIDYAQVVSIFSRTRIRWPPLVKQIFLILSAFNVNLELAAPECLLENVTFYNKWLAIEMLPLLAIGFLGILYMLKLSYKACCLNKKKNQLHSHLPIMISVFIVAFRVLYLFLTRSALDVFNCSPTDPPDGNQYMSGMLDVICWESGSIQMKLLPYGILAIFVYVVGLPVLAYFFLRKKRDAIKYDQILRIQGLGDDRRTNPRFYKFRKTWSKLYYHFAPGKWYWEAIILCRKFLIAFTSLMFRQTPSYQLAVALLVLFVAFVLQVRSQPYITSINRAEILRAHALKVFQGDPLHRTIEADMRAVEKANTRNTKKQLSLTDTGRNDDSAKWSTATAALRKAFDYNTVEAVLLGCCILINLAGIMFDSARFQGELAQYYQKEYDSLTYATIILILLSLVYYLWCLIADIIVTCSPKSAAILCTCTRVEDAVDKLKKGKGSRQRKNDSINPLAPPSKLDDNDDGTISMHNNPFMANGGLRATTNGTAGGFDVREIETMNQPPDPITWLTIRSSYILSLKTADSLTKQVMELKKVIETGDATKVMDEDLSSSATPAAIALLNTTKQRRTFDPTPSGSSTNKGSISPLDTANPLRVFKRSNNNNSNSSNNRGTNISIQQLKRPTSPTANNSLNDEDNNTNKDDGTGIIPSAEL